MVRGRPEATAMAAGLRPSGVRAGGEGGEASGKREKEGKKGGKPRKEGTGGGQIYK